MHIASHSTLHTAFENRKKLAWGTPGRSVSAMTTFGRAVESRSGKQFRYHHTPHTIQHPSADPNSQGSIWSRPRSGSPLFWSCLQTNPQLRSNHPVTGQDLGRSEFLELPGPESCLRTLDIFGIEGGLWQIGSIEGSLWTSRTWGKAGETWCWPWVSYVMCTVNQPGKPCPSKCPKQTWVTLLRVPLHWLLPLRIANCYLWACTPATWAWIENANIWTKCQGASIGPMHTVLRFWTFWLPG